MNQKLDEAFVVDPWQNGPYEQNPEYPEEKIYEAPGGLMVRTPGEVTIVECLQKHGIAFRYEAALDIGGEVMYPTFTIKHPKTGELVYWENFFMG